MAFYGRRVTSGDTDYGIVGQNQQRTSVYDKMPVNGWGYSIGFWGGRVIGSGSPTVKLAVWSTSNLTPATRMAYHNGISVSTNQSYGGDGQSYSVPIQNVNSALSPGTNAIKLFANRNYAIGLVSTGTHVGHAMVQASRINGDNEQFYHRDGVTAPTNPNGYTYSSNEGWISAWIEYVANRTPTATASSPSGLITTTDPNFSGSFSDADEVYGDHLNTFRIEVRQSSNNALKWDSGVLAATSTEQSTGNFTRNYSGSALTAGVEYKWRVRVSDDFGTWSSWSSYRTFTINGGGAVTTQNTPTGKQNSVQPTPFTARWTHASGLSMNAVQVRLKQGNSVIRNGTSVVKAVANNGTISTTWAEQFGSYNLSWGVTSYSWEMRGRDSSNLWSDWSSAQPFSTNNPPDIPYNLTPTNSQPSTSRPVLRATATDADGDTVTVKARIKNAAGSVLFTRTMVRSGNTFTYQTTSTDLATHGTYKWDAYSYDGHLYSGTFTSEASAVKSAEASFIYGEGPEVTITGPLGTVSTSSPIIEWTADDQVKYRLTLSNNGEVVYDTGTITSTAQSHVVPSGILRNEQEYDVAVTVTNSAPLSGTSEVVTFSVAYPTPEALTGLYSSPEFQKFDATPSSIRLTWNESADPNFLEYMIIRSDGLNEVILDRITSPSQNVFIDFNPESGLEYTYSVVQSTLQGLDVTVSPPSSVQASINLDHVVLTDVFDGAERRAGLRLDSERSFEHVDDLVLEHAWGRSAPIAMYGTAQYQTFDGQFKLATDEFGNARDHIEALRNLWRSRATVCYRDERGRRFFAKITKFSEDDKRVQFYTVSLTLTEVNYEEGVL